MSDATYYFSIMEAIEQGATRTLLMNGLDPKKDLGTYMIVVISHICNLSKTEVQLLEKEDYEVLNQICSVF